MIINFMVKKNTKEEFIIGIILFYIAYFPTSCSYKEISIQIK
jgi:hypothetical protein